MSTLDGFKDGMEFYFCAQVGDLADLEVWNAAAGQILQLGRGRGQPAAQLVQRLSPIATGRASTSASATALLIHAGTVVSSASSATASRSRLPSKVREPASGPGLAFIAPGGGSRHGRRPFSPSCFLHRWSCATRPCAARGRPISAFWIRPAAEEEARHGHDRRVHRRLLGRPPHLCFEVRLPFPVDGRVLIVKRHSLMALIELVQILVRNAEIHGPRQTDGYENSQIMESLAVCWIVTLPIIIIGDRVGLGQPHRRPLPRLRLSAGCQGLGWAMSSVSVAITAIVDHPEEAQRERRVVPSQAR